MYELDELSRTLGKIEADVKNVKDAQNKHFPLLHKKIDDLDKAFSSHRVRIAYQSGGLSASLTVLILYVKSKLF